MTDIPALNAITDDIIGSAIKIHKEFGRFVDQLQRSGTERWRPPGGNNLRDEQGRLA